MSGAWGWAGTAEVSGVTALGDEDFIDIEFTAVHEFGNHSPGRATSLAPGGAS